MAVFLFYIILMLAVLLAVGTVAELIAVLIGGIHPWDFS